MLAFDSINQLTGNRNRLSPPDLTAEQHDALMVLLKGKSYSDHLAWNGREYFCDGGLWVVAWSDDKSDSGDQIERHLQPITWTSWLNKKFSRKVVK